MKRILAPLLFLTLLFPSLAYGVSSKQLVQRDGLWYERSAQVPFTGKTTGLTQATLKNGVLDGPFIKLYSNGQLMYQIEYKNGKKHGPIIQYSYEGKLFSIGNYQDDKMHGRFTMYYTKNGQVMSDGNFIDDEKDGRWVSFNRDGTKDEVLSGIYKNGKKIHD